MSTTTTTGERWMIYGAYGYTGALLVEEAVKRGHKPVLAGRDRTKLEDVARPYQLETIAVSLDDTDGLARAVRGCHAVLHAAGPFVWTAEAMRAACLTEGASYADITGEIDVLEGTFALDAQAKARGIAMISGVGFDVVPTDCLAKHVADALPGAQTLEIAIAPIGRASSGTLTSALEAAPKGGFVRRGGALVRERLFEESKRVRFSDRERWVTSIPWGDLSSAWVTTKIPDITTYLAVPHNAARVLRLVGGAVPKVMSIDAFRSLLRGRLAGGGGPDAGERARGKSLVWARATRVDGTTRDAWLETLEGYAFTAVAGVRAIEHLLRDRPRGALTPSLAFGADFVLEIEGTRRLDALPS